MSEKERHTGREREGAKGRRDWHSDRMGTREKDGIILDLTSDDPVPMSLRLRPKNRLVLVQRSDHEGPMEHWIEMALEKAKRAMECATGSAC